MSDETFESLNPRTGEVVGTFPVHTADDVAAVVKQAADAAAWWSALTFDERATYLQAWKRLMTRRLKELAELESRENGKPVGDAVLNCSSALIHLDWAASHAEKVLRRQRRNPGAFLANMEASVEFRPLGVVGVIGPWNYPFYTPMGSISYALAAGNAVVFKPSEYTPAVGQWLVERWNDVCDVPVVQLVTGFGESGAALCRSGVHKIAFTGSAATGRKVMAACAESLTPVLIEAGGKDAFIVDADADLDAAADAASWGACFNAGQSCAGVERIYVHQDVHDEFVAKLVERVRSLTPPDQSGAAFGPITMPGQIDIIRRHIDAALADGGRAIVGGPDAVGERFVAPTILVDVPESSAAVQEETFGPTVTVRKVQDMDEAVALANGTPYGLGSTVFSQKNGESTASRLRAGMTAINTVLSFAGVPSLPFGGVGESGFGRAHGPEGLKEFTYVHATARKRFTNPIRLNTFTRTRRDERIIAGVMRVLHGRK